MDCITRVRSLAPVWFLGSLSCARKLREKNSKLRVAFNLAAQVDVLAFETLEAGPEVAGDVDYFGHLASDAFLT